MPKQYSLNSLLDDVLREVEESSATEKVAEATPTEFTSEVASYINGVAQALREVGMSESVSQDDLKAYFEKHAGKAKVVAKGAKKIGDTLGWKAPVAIGGAGLGAGALGVAAVSGNNQAGNQY